MEPTEVDVTKITYYNADGTPQSSGTGTGTGTGSGTGTGWIGSLFGAIPGILSALFPSGVTGNNNQYPYVSTLPNGNTNVQLAGQNNLMIYLLIGVVLFMFFTGKPAIKPARKR